MRHCFPSAGVLPGGVFAHKDTDAVPENYHGSAADSHVFFRRHDSCVFKYEAVSYTHLDIKLMIFPFNNYKITF